MCRMCEECDARAVSEYDPACESCQDCGAMICFDVKGGDDVMRGAYVTESGDLFCNRCGPRYDRDAEEDDYDEGANI